MSKWISMKDGLPEEGVEVETKIDDTHGIRNIQTLTRKGHLYFYPDMSMYVYYNPTHWRPSQKTPEGQNGLKENKE